MTEKEVTEETTEEKQVEEKSKEQELTETLQRLQAEFENFKKRNENEKQSFAKFANASLITKFLLILDDFELALNNATEKNDFYKGMEMIYSKTVSLLKDEGLQEIEAKDQKFDPVKHEAMLTEVSDKEENTVLEVLQKGYTLNDSILRTAKVKVAKK